MLIIYYSYLNLILRQTNLVMQNYLNLIQTVLNEGQWQTNRTGIRTLSMPGASLRYDLKKTFPAITTRKLAFKAAIGELIGFLRATRNAATFRELGCKVWDQNANQNENWLANPFRQGEDDLGDIYGVQWRQWPAYKTVSEKNNKQQEAVEKAGYLKIAATTSGDSIYYRQIDQLKNCLQTIVENPSDRRILFHAWNPAELDQMALPPCHLLYQFLPYAETKELSMCLYVRSNDLGLGTPFNLCEAAALLHLVAHLTGYQARWLNYFIGDAHIYENQIEMLKTQLSRSPYNAPFFQISSRVPKFAETKQFAPEWLSLVEPNDFSLINYQHHPALTAAMAV